MHRETGVIVSGALTDDTPAYAAIWWGFNGPGYVLYARVLPNHRVYAQAECKFIHQPVEAVAALARELWLSKDWPKPRMIFAGPTLWDTREVAFGVKAESIAQVFARAKLPLVPSHGEPLHGWQRVQDYLRDAPDGRPWFIASPDCKLLARTLPALVQRKTNPDDIDGPDYAAHALRLLIQSRPNPALAPRQAAPYAWGTVGWLRGRDRAPKGLLSR